ncbi:MAG: Gfo/Idh/MocA family oxidoreductase [Clostridia bacterium]|nr:Gfo/Idh/MocA family oxidoreductase [Clostridia bacterium]
MKQVRIGVIGCGAIANSYHLPALARIPEAKLVWACDLIEDRARSAMEKYGFEKMTLDYHDILSDETIDAVCIFTKIEMHAILAIEFARAHKSIFMQKPFAYSIEEGRRIIRAVEENGVRLVPSFMHSYMDGPLAVKEIIDSGKIGALQHIRIRNATWNPLHTVSSYGGCMMDIGVHGMNLVATLTGEQIQKVYAARLWYEGEAKPTAYGESADLSGNENAAALMYELESGLTVEHEIFWFQVTHTERFEVEVYGTRGAVYLRHHNNLPVLECGFNTTGTPDEKAQWIRPEVENHFFGENHHRTFVLDVLNNTHLSKTHREGFVPLQVVEAARRSAVTRRQETVLGI